MIGSADRGEPQSVMDAAVLANSLLGGGLPPRLRARAFVPGDVHA